MRCLGVVPDTTVDEVFALLKAIGVEPEGGDGNLGMTEIDVPESDAPKAMKVLLEWRAMKAESCFMAADELRESEIYQLQYGEGMRDLAWRHYASAAGHLSTAVSLRPTSYEALYARACVRRLWGRINDAREDCRRILKLDPETAYDPYQGHNEFKAKAAALLKELQDQ
jgi:tetratricopeptide (TPR) repeat protein